jgi:L-proline amide hydrolase
MSIAPFTAYVSHRGRRVWTQTHGRVGASLPLVCVPGGPGVSHHYLAPLARLAASGRPVIFYDPLGSGASERPAGEVWNEDVYVDELEAVCLALAPSGYVLYAHSVAGFAVYPLAFRRAPGLRGLVLASAPSSMPAYQASARRLLDLPPAELAAFELADHDPARRDAPYARACQRLLLQHFCRARPSPPEMWQSIHERNPEAHRAMKGGGILYTSALRDWDVTARLAEIAVPALVTCGEHDVLTPEMCARIARGIPGAELEVFPGCSHMPHLEDPERYLARVQRFLHAISGTRESS